MPLFCKDCKHSMGVSDRMRCDSPRNAVEVMANQAKFLVTGEPQKMVMAALGAGCDVLRSTEVHPTLGIQLCGYAGNWFEAKE